MRKKKKQLDDLIKARDHLLRATAEGIVGTGYAVKGIRNLIKEKDSRKFLLDSTGKLLGTGFAIMMTFADIIRQTNDDKSKQTRKKTRKRTRQIKID